MKILAATICAILLFTGNILPQLTAVVSIENQQAVGTDFFFDLYIRSSSSGEIIYLGNSDFVLTFEAGNFSGPVIYDVGPEPGYCTFVPTNQTAFNIQFTQISYFNSTSDTISVGSNQIIINVDGPAPGSQTTLNNYVARIDNTPSINCLGRFKVSGITNPSGFMNLQWVTGSTLVGSYNPSTLEDIQIPVITEDPANAPLPVELASFIAAFNNLEVMLSWKTETEVNNFGFNVERRINDGDWDSIVFIEGHGNSNSPKDYSYTDKDLFAGGSKFQYRLKQVDNDGQFEYSDVVEVEVVPDQYELSQNYPNPFNPSTTIRFSLPKETQLKINLYNMLGELVETIAEGTYETGYYKVTFNASNLPSGAYVYRIESSDFIQTKKMVLIK
jgi:hypothetical protein